MRFADVLTGSRIVAAPVVACLIFWNHTVAAYYVFGAGVLTDLLDGYFARRSKKTTTYGANFDALADLAIINATVISLGVKGGAFWLFMAGMATMAMIVAVMTLISLTVRKLTLPHLDTNILAAFVYSTIMVYIIDWQYADHLLILTFVVILFYAVKYIRYLMRLRKLLKQ